MTDLTLYVDAFWTSPYAFSAFVALEEKQLPYEVRELALHKDENHAEDYERRSLTGRVPSLRHGDFWLSESSAIAEYLAEVFPFPKHPRLFPEDLQQRGRARQLMAWVRSDLMPIRTERPTSTVFFEQRAERPLTDAGQKAAAKLVKTAEQLIGEGSTSLFGAWCLADTDLAMMLQRLNANGEKLPAKVKAYVDAQWQRPSVRKWVEHTRPPFVPYA